MAEFHKDLQEMMDLAKKQPGFISAEVFQPQGKDNVFLVLSQWESRDQSSVFEHVDEHEDIMDKYEDRYSEQWIKTRYVPM